MPKLDLSLSKADEQRFEHVLDGVGSGGRPLFRDVQTSHAPYFHEQIDRDLTIAVINECRFSRECLVTALGVADAGIRASTFASVEDCIVMKQNNFDVIAYYSHARSCLSPDVTAHISLIRQSFSDTPLIILSEAEDAHHPKAIREVLKDGARGLVAIRNTGVSIAVAAIRFVKAGGTFAPLDLLTENPSRAVLAPKIKQPDLLTARQIAVLTHLKQGKANKAIAYKLGISESTVKVHVRNIIRKMGATNRTQAAYNAQTMWESDDAASPPVY